MEAEGYLLIGTNERRQVVIDFGEDRTGHIVFSPLQARELAHKLLGKADEATDGQTAIESATRTVDVGSCPADPDHTPIPVSAAVNLATAYRKSMVVILAYDPRSQLSHCTTYGAEPADKEIAADVGEKCMRLICGDGVDLKTTYQDFRYQDQAKLAAKLRALRDFATMAAPVLAVLMKGGNAPPAAAVKELFEYGQTALAMEEPPPTEPEAASK